MAGAANELGHSGVNSCAEIGGLIGLGSFKPQILILGSEIVHLSLDKEVLHVAVVVICILDDVAGGGLNQVAQVAGICLVLVGDSVDRPLGLTATVADLMADVVEPALYVIAKVANTLVDGVTHLVYGRIHARKALTKGILYAGKTVESIGVLRVEAITQAVLDAVEFVVDTLGVKTSLYLAKYATVSAAEATAEATKSVATAKQSGQHDDGEEIPSPCAASE